MRRLFICIIILCASTSYKMYSQATVANVTNTIAGTDYLGSSNNFNLNFRTFNNPRIRILTGGLTGNGATTDGFVGIGDFNFFYRLVTIFYFKL